MVLPERLTSSTRSLPARLWDASRRIACWATHRSMPWIRPKRSAVARKAAGATSPPSSPRILISSSYWVTSLLEQVQDRLGSRGRRGPARSPCGSRSDQTRCGSISRRGPWGRTRRPGCGPASLALYMASSAWAISSEPVIRSLGERGDADADRHPDGSGARSRSGCSAISSQQSSATCWAFSASAPCRSIAELVAAQPREHVRLAQAAARAARRCRLSSSSPARWPSVSFTYLKLSRSDDQHRAAASRSGPRRRCACRAPARSGAG